VERRTVAGWSFESVLRSYPWSPLRGCPGRYVLKQIGRDLAPAELLDETVHVLEYRVPGTPDALLLTAFVGGGVISYRKPDGSYVHTLSTSEGLVRRLQRLGIEWPTPG
jgi:hypothetical protein